MRIEVEKQRLLIIPETPQDEVMLEETFGMKDEGNSVPLVRCGYADGGCWGCLEAKRQVR